MINNENNKARVICSFTQIMITIFNYTLSLLFQFKHHSYRIMIRKGK